MSWHSAVGDSIIATYHPNNHVGHAQLRLGQNEVRVLEQQRTCLLELWTCISDGPDDNSGDTRYFCHFLLAEAVFRLNNAGKCISSREKYF